MIYFEVKIYAGDTVVLLLQLARRSNLYVRLMFTFPRYFFTYTSQTWRRMYCARYVLWVEKPFVACNFGSRYRLYVAYHEAITKHCSLMRLAFQHRHLPWILCKFNVRIWYGKVTLLLLLLLLLLYCYFNIIVLEKISTCVRASIFPAF